MVKQGLPHVRIAADWRIPAERTCREAEFYRNWGASAEGAVPAVIDLDASRCILVMEYLADCAPWRDELLAGRWHAEAAPVLGRRLARTGFGSSVLGLPPADREARMAQAANPDLERLMEDVLFLQPWAEHPRNAVPADIAGPVRRLRDDGAFQARVAALHAAFRFRREVLAHGDLHTGSIMVGAGGARIFDGEFARYAPAAFDLGELWGSLLLAAVGAAARDRDPAAVVALIRMVWEAYTDEMHALWTDRVIPAHPAFLDHWLADTLRLAVGFAGIETGRRLIGLGKVEDIETVPAPRLASARRTALGLCETWVKDDFGSLDEGLAMTARRLRGAS